MSFASITDGEDFTGINEQLTFLPHENFVVKCLCVFVPITGDEEMEDIESFEIELTTTDPCVNISEGSATVLIVDSQCNDGVVEISFSEGQYTVVEGEGSVQVCAELTGGKVTTPVVVSVSTVSDVAVGKGACLLKLPDLSYYSFCLLRWARFHWCY